MAKKSKKSKKSSKSEHMEEAPMRSTLQEGREAIQVAREAYPAMLELGKQYDPEFAALEARTTGARAAGEIEVVKREGAQMRQALLDTSPELAAGREAMMKNLAERGATPMEQELMRQTEADLKLEGALSADELRAAVQGSRAAAVARGMNGSRGAVYQEVLARAGASNARKRERQAAAGQVLGLRQARLDSDTAGTINTSNALAGQWDPRLVLGRGGSAASGVVQGPQQFGQFSSLAASVGESNAASQLAFANMKSGERQAELEREASLNQFNLQRQDTMANAAAARKSNMTGAMVGAGATVAVGLLIF